MIKNLLSRPSACHVFLVAGILFAPGAAKAQLLDILTAPATLIERAVEARSIEDIAKDNELVLEVNKLMGDVGTLDASTEVYEQRLLVTGVFESRNDMETLRSKIEKVDGLKKLYWHAFFATEDQQDGAGFIGWPEAVKLDASAGANLIATKGVADVNMRIAVDAKATAYILGRARSDDEKDMALKAVRNTSGVRKVINYLYVRP